MTPKQINRAIAELCGWKPGPGQIGFCKAWFEICGETLLPEHQVPDYFHDLNACAEFERTLDVNVGSEDSPRYAYSTQVYNIVPQGQQPFRATAPQRCEAFLRLHGKWKE